MHDASDNSNNYADVERHYDDDNDDDTDVKSDNRDYTAVPEREQCGKCKSVTKRLNMNKYCVRDYGKKCSKNF